MGMFDWKTREQIIHDYHKIHPRKCPKCGNSEIGITYTTGTGVCLKCRSSLMLSIKGVVANQREKKPDGSLGSCHLYFEDGSDLDCKEKDCVWGPVFCEKIEHICL